MMTSHAGRRLTCSVVTVVSVSVPSSRSSNASRFDAGFRNADSALWPSSACETSDCSSSSTLCAVVSSSCPRCLARSRSTMSGMADWLTRLGTLSARD